MEGYILTAISAAFLASTVTADKLMVGDFYQEEPRNAWFVSTFLGSLFGLLATVLAWTLFGNVEILSKSVSLMQGEHVGFGILMVLAGILVSLTLRSYFFCMSNGNTSSSVAIAIAATPVFVFSLQVFVQGDDWRLMHGIAVLVTIAGLVGFELAPGYERSKRRGINWALLGVISFGTLYLVLIDAILPLIESEYNVNETHASLIAMPWYWFGFAIGTLSILNKNVQNFLSVIFHRWKFIGVVLILEIIGAGFYFFEFLGLSQISATLVALIVGAHVVLVWMFDIYIRSQYLNSITHNTQKTTILFFELPTKTLEEYDVSNKVLLLQFVFIVLTLAGIFLWPLQ